MAAIHSKYYAQLQEVGQAVVTRIWKRLKDRGVRGLTFPERLEVANALARVNDAEKIIVEEIALSDDPAFRHALDRLERLEDEDE